MAFFFKVTTMQDYKRIRLPPMDGHISFVTTARTYCLSPHPKTNSHLMSHQGAFDDSCKVSNVDGTQDISRDCRKSGLVGQHAHHPSLLSLSLHIATLRLLPQSMAAGRNNFKGWIWPSDRRPGQSWKRNRWSSFKDVR